MESRHGARHSSSKHRLKDRYLLTNAILSRGHSPPVLNQHGSIIHRPYFPSARLNAEPKSQVKLKYFSTSYVNEDIL